MAQFSLDEMWNDLAAADAAGDYELANHIAGLIRQQQEAEAATPEEEPSFLERMGGMFNPAKRSAFQDEGEVDEFKDTVRGAAGGISSALYGAAGGIADMAAATSDLVNPFEDFTGSARETVRPFVEEMQDIQGLEMGISQENAPEGFLARAAYDSTIAFGQMLPVIGTFMITKNPNAALSVMGASVGGQTWSEKKAAG